MTAPHFFLDDIDGDTVSLSDQDAAHAARALRLRPGEEITVSDGRGRVVVARLTEVSARDVSGVVTARTTVERAPPYVAVAVALPKAGKLELVVQKLTELGIDEIALWPAERSVVRWDDRKAAANTERLRAIAYEAAKQSRRPWLPAVVEPRPPVASPGETFVLHEGAVARLRASLPAEPPDRITVVVGPEGGLSEAEVARFASAGVAVVGLGPQILRAETAAIVAPALVLARYGRFG